MKGKILAALRIILSSVLVLAVVLPVMWSVNQETAKAAWWNSSWSYRQVISFNATSLTSNLTDFPLTLYLDSSNLDFSKVAANGTDLRFVDKDDTTELYYERVVWDDTSETATVIVHVPQIDSASDFTDYIYMYYGNGVATDAHNPGETWNGTDAVLVHHYYAESNNGTIVYDSTLNNNDGTVTNAVWSSSGRVFDTTAYINSGNSSSLNFERTDEFTILTRFKTVNKNDFLCAKQLSAGTFAGYNFLTDASGREMTYIVNDIATNYTQVRGNTDTSDNNSHQGSLVNLALAEAAASDIRFYLDGNLQANTTISDTLGANSIQSSANFVVGGRGTSGSWDGLITDMLVFADAKSGEWIDFYHQASQELWTGTDGQAVYFGGENPIPSVGTATTSGISMTTAGVTSGTMSCNVTDMGASPAGQYYFQLGTTSGVYTVNTTATDFNSTGAKTASIPNNLTPNDTYYYRMYVTTDNGDNQSAESSFTLTMPTVTATATYPGASSVIVDVNVSDMGVASGAGISVVYGTDGITYGSTSAATSITATGTYSITIPAPNDATTLYCKPAVTVGSVTTYGATSSVAVPSGAGGSLLKVLLRTILAAVIMISLFFVFRVGGIKAVIVAAAIGVIGFILIDGFIGLI